MNKILISFLGFVLISGGVAYAETTINEPSTFNLKVGSSVYVSNYQNMKVTLTKTNIVNEDVCKNYQSTQPCPMLAKQPIQVAYIEVNTEGGCGPNADSRCLGAPAFSNSYEITLGSEVKALGLTIKAVEVNTESATLKVSTAQYDMKSLPPEPPVQVKEIPIGSDTDKGQVISGSKVIEGKSIMFPINTITICPVGKEDCTVCSKGECKEKTVPYTEGTDTAPGLRMITVPKNAEIQSVDKDPESTTTPAYKVKAIRKARLLFLFPVSAEINYSVDAKTGSSTEISKPWWSFLAW